MNIVFEQNNIILASTNIKEKAFLEQIKDVEFITSGSKKDPRTGMEEKFVVLLPKNTPPETKVLSDNTVSQSIGVNQQKTDDGGLQEILQSMRSLIEMENENKEIRNKQIRLLEQNITWLSEQTKDIIKTYKEKIRKLDMKKDKDVTTQKPDPNEQ